jgi:L-alanine-DL-glutamate epimerase-like enolase superfamily enzyme
VPNFLVLEWHRLSDPNWEKLALTKEPLIQEGYIVLPEEPGLGIELNEDFLRQLTPGGKLFE